MAFDFQLYTKNIYLKIGLLVFILKEYGFNFYHSFQLIVKLIENYERIFVHFFKKVYSNFRVIEMQDNIVQNNPYSKNDIVQVHLVIHQQNEDLKIEFEFNKKEDDIDTVVSELIETLGMTESDKEMIKGLIEQQINPPQKPNSNTHTDPYFEPINIENQQSDSDDTSDDSDITDPDYRSLLEQQKREMDALLATHLSERRELAQRIQAETMHQIQQQQIRQQQMQQQQPQSQPQSAQPQPQPQQQPPPPNSVQPNPPIVINAGQQTQQTSTATSIPIINNLPANNAPTNSVCDDLIDFK